MNRKQILHEILSNKKRIVSVVIIAVVFIAVAVGAIIGAKKVDPKYGARENFKETAGKDPLDAIINEYFDCYADNDITRLEEIAYPLTDMEKSYIAFMSTYIDKYEVSQVFSKPGIDKSSYLVSVDVNIKFKDMENSSPGLYFFYVMTDNDKNLYIDNRYCIFNQQYIEEDTDPDIQALIEEYENQQDFIVLQHDINSRYNTLIESDEQFSGFIASLRDATITWYSDYQAAVEAQIAEEAAAAEAEAAAQAEAEAAAQAEAEAAAAAEAEAAAAEEAANHVAEGGYTAGTEVTVSDILNIREQPDSNSTKVGAVLAGGTVKVLENSGDNGWTKVERGRIVGYIRTDLLR